MTAFAEKVLNKPVMCICDFQSQQFLITSRKDRFVAIALVYCNYLFDAAAIQVYYMTNTGTGSPHLMRQISDKL